MGAQQQYVQQPPPQQYMQQQPQNNHYQYQQNNNNQYQQNQTVYNGQNKISNQQQVDNWDSPDEQTQNIQPSYGNVKIQQKGNNDLDKSDDDKPQQNNNNKKKKKRRRKKKKGSANNTPSNELNNDNNAVSVNEITENVQKLEIKNKSPQKSEEPKNPITKNESSP